jgi:hypothetical protein
MTATREQILEERRRLRNEYGQLYQDLAQLLFRHDPIGINFENNTDEYEPEVGTILPRLRACKSEGDVLQVVHEEFARWFGQATAGAKESYAKVATETWQLWMQFSRR